MELLFSPWFNGKTYVDYARHEGGLFGKAVASQAGLLGRLELLAGMSFPKEPDEESRVREYHKILSIVLGSDDPLYKSFSADVPDVSYKTTTELLRWRDMLVMAGWDGVSPLPEGKLKGLEKAERLIKPGCAIALGEADRWRTIAGLAGSIKADVTVYSPKELLPNVVQQVLDRLGAKYEYSYIPGRTLNKDKFRVLECQELTQSYEWLAQQEPNAGQLVACADGLRLDSVMRCFGKPVTEDAQVGCHQVADSIFCMLDEPESLIWLDCYGDYGLIDQYTFMNSSELETFRIPSFSDRLEIMHDYYIYTLNRVRGQVILISAKRDIDESLARHPVLALLGKKAEKLSIVDRLLPEKQEIKFQKKSEYNIGRGIDIKHVMSATSLEELLQRPFDYVVEKELGLNDPGDASQLNVEEGKVAHKVVELLVKEGKKLAMNDDVFKEALEEEGDLLLLPENRFELESFKETLGISLEALDEIIRNNSLTPISCEVKMETSMPSYGPGKAFIDMTLKTADGKDVIFDFKYSNSDRYAEKLENNRSVQFAFYREIFKQQTGSDVVAIGYYLFPKCTLYVPYGLGDSIIKGNHVQVVIPEDDTDLQQQLARSFSKRKKQLTDGLIEEAEGMPIADLNYTKEEGLFALEEGQKKGIKQGPYNPTNIVLKNQIR